MIALTPDETPPPLDRGGFPHEWFNPLGTQAFHAKVGHQSQGPHALHESGIMSEPACTERRDRMATSRVLHILVCLHISQMAQVAA
jgi:hypothetical protein